MPLTAIEEKHLLDLAEKLGLDTQEIDHELSYYENKAHLEELGHVEKADVETQALSYLEQEAAELGRRIVTEEEHGKLVDLAVRLEKLKQRQRKVTEAEKRLGGAKPSAVMVSEKIDQEAIEEVKRAIKDLDRKVNHRVISDKIKKHKKAKKEKTAKVSCAYLMKRCKRAGLSKGKCKVIMPYHCKRRVPVMPEMPSMPEMGSPEKVKAKRYVWRHK